MTHTGDVREAQQGFVGQTPPFQYTQPYQSAFVSEEIKSSWRKTQYKHTPRPGCRVVTVRPHMAYPIAPAQGLPLVAPQDMEAPAAHHSHAGIIALVALIIIGGVGAVVYFLLCKRGGRSGNNGPTSVTIPPAGDASGGDGDNPLCQATLVCRQGWYYDARSQTCEEAANTCSDDGDCGSDAPKCINGGCAPLSACTPADSTLPSPQGFCCGTAVESGDANGCRICAQGACASASDCGQGEVCLLHPNPHCGTPPPCSCDASCTAAVAGTNMVCENGTCAQNDNPYVPKSKGLPGTPCDVIQGTYDPRDGSGFCAPGLLCLSPKQSGMWKAEEAPDSAARTAFLALLESGASSWCWCLNGATDRCAAITTSAPTSRKTCTGTPDCNRLAAGQVSDTMLQCALVYTNEEGPTPQAAENKARYGYCSATVPCKSQSACCSGDYGEDQVCVGPGFTVAEAPDGSMVVNGIGDISALGRCIARTWISRNA